MHSFEFDVMTFSPEEAANILHENGLETDGAADETGGYAADMECGRWILNGDAIIFDEEAKLVDGRKRLQACVRSARPLRTLVVRGVGQESHATIGTHRRRTMADTLKILGAGDHSAALAKAIGFSLHFASGTWTRLKGRAQRSLFIAMRERYPEMEVCVDEALRCHGRLVTPGIYAASLFLLGRVDRDAASAFVRTALSNDVPAPLSGPVLSLRKRLESERELRRSLIPYEMFGLIIKTWNAWREMRDLSRPKMDKNEPFPLIAGWKRTMDLDTSLERSEDVQDLVMEDFDVTVEIADILPADAAEMLRNMVPNRLIVKSKVDPIIRDLEAGSWFVNGQTVKFDESGRLCDGQHRLTACVRSGLPLRTIVVRGVPESAFGTFDAQSTKNFGDYLASLGLSNSSHLSAALRLLWAIQDGSPSSAPSPSNSELRRYYENNQDTKQFAGHWWSLADILQPSVAIAATVLCHRIDAAQAETFFARLRDGASLASDSPILIARNHITSSARKQSRKRGSGGYSETIRLLAFVINTWNAWRDQKSVANHRGFEWDFNKKPGVAFPVAR